MKLQTAAFLESAQTALDDAKTIASVGVHAQAARLAYFVQFHAAQAFIFERTGKTNKTHKGVQTSFHKLAKDDPAIGTGLAVTLSATYYFKEAADYQTGAVQKITPQHSARAIQDAGRFLAAVKNALGTDAGSPKPG